MHGRQKEREAEARAEAVRAVGLLVVVVLGVAVIISVVAVVAGVVVTGLLRASRAQETDPRQQLQRLLAAEMSWHHAALESLAVTPEAMADADRYVAGEIGVDKLARRADERGGQQ